MKLKHSLSRLLTVIRGAAFNVALDRASRWLEFTCQPYYAAPIKKVSTPSLPKTGVFRRWAGDFREILAQVAGFRRLD
jgi:hypothetical protein